MSFYTEDSVEAGYLGLYFSDPMMYSLWPCGDWAYITATLPTTESKIWTLEKRRTLTKTSLSLHCNDVLIVELIFPNCSFSEKCVTMWNYNMQKIYFYSDYDTASEGFKQQPVDPGLYFFI